MKRLMVAVLLLYGGAALANDVAKWDPAMAASRAETDEDGVKWINGHDLPYEGRAFDDVAFFYDRLPAGVTWHVNYGVQLMKHHSAGLQVRFTTDSDFVVVKFVNNEASKGYYHMSELGTSGVDVYRQDPGSGKWRYVSSSHRASVVKINAEESARVLRCPWKKGEACLVNLPLYNGIQHQWIGIAKDATIGPSPPHCTGVEKPVVFYGTSITHGCSASRAGLAFPAVIGRELDVPIVLVPQAEGVKAVHEKLVAEGARNLLLADGCGREKLEDAVRVALVRGKELLRRR